MKWIMKRLIPIEVRNRIKKWFACLEIIFLNIFSSANWLSSKYYGFISNSFGNEHRAVIAGRLNYSSSITQSDQNNYGFRRNIHRLEKGMLYRQSREVYGLQYIEHTVKQFEDLCKLGPKGLIDPYEISWARSILERYFEVAGNHPIIQRSLEKYKTIEIPKDIDRTRVPYFRSATPRHDVDYESLYALALTRRSVRWYLDKPVPHSKIDKAVKLAALSPSACNRQPFKFLFFEDYDRIQEISSLAGGASGFRHNIPLLLVIVGSLRAFKEEKDRHLIYIDGSMAAMSFMFALETLDLSSCCLNWPDISSQERKIAATLDLDTDQRIVLLMAIGYADPEGLIAYSQKKSLEAMRSINPS